MTNGISTRELALDILLSVNRDGEYSHIALKNTLDKYQYLEKKDRAFLTRVVEGTLENRIRIDYIIDQFSNTKVKKMKPVIREILRSAVYQIFFMDKVPDSAACNEAVKLAQKRGFHNLRGFVNGVLRNIARGKDSIVYPDKSQDWTAYMSVYYSLPEWLVTQWEQAYGREKTEEMAQAFLVPQPTCVRIDTERTDKETLIRRLHDEGVQVKEHETLPDALYLTEYDYLNKIPCFQEGLFYIQDASSMMVAQVAQPKAGDVVLDLCGAPGGKSIHIAQIMQGTGQVITRDLTPYKVHLIEENIERCQVTNMRAECADARILDESMIEQADIVIADLPCSGLGVIGKKKDIKYKMTPQAQADLEALQRDILSVAHQYVKKGGILVFSTCTVNETENTQNAHWFMKEHPHFYMEYEKQIFPEAAKCDGFYIAKFRRNES